MRSLLVSVLFVLVPGGVALADQPAPPAKNDDAPKCLLVKVEAKDLAPAVGVDYTAKLKGKKATPVVAKALCKTSAIAAAGKWAKENGLCEKPKMIKLTATLSSKDGKVETFANLSASCPK